MYEINIKDKQNCITLHGDDTLAISRLVECLIKMEGCTGIQVLPIDDTEEYFHIPPNYQHEPHPDPKLEDDWPHIKDPVSIPQRVDMEKSGIEEPEIKISSTNSRKIHTQLQKIHDKYVDTEPKEFNEIGSISKQEIEHLGIEATIIQSHTVVYELNDGRVRLEYFHTIVCAMKETIVELPYPVPPNYLSNLSPQKKAAIKAYRRYLDKRLQLEQDTEPPEHTCLECGNCNGTCECDDDYKPQLKKEYHDNELGLDHSEDPT